MILLDNAPGFIFTVRDFTTLVSGLKDPLYLLKKKKKKKMMMRSARYLFAKQVLAHEKWCSLIVHSALLSKFATIDNCFVGVSEKNGGSVMKCGYT